MDIYLADRDHPAYGVVRAIVRDDTDTANTLTFLDSDGAVNSNANRSSSGGIGGGGGGSSRNATHAGGWVGWVVGWVW